MTIPVCLVIPPSIFLLDERVFANLGILKVAASLEATGYEVEMLDLSGVANYEDAVEDYARQTMARWFGVTATTPQMPAAAKIARKIRSVLPDAVITLGGPHGTLVAAAFKGEVRRDCPGRAERALHSLQEQFDVVVAGDGEDAVLEAVARGRCSPGRVIDADDPKGPLFLTNQRYDATPQPARHLIDLSSYHYYIEGARATSLIAQLGCPFGCGFCGGRQSPMLRKIRTRTTESIVREIEGLHKEYGYTGFMFYDDELNVNKDMVELMDAITKLQEELGVEFRLRGFVKAELFKKEQAEAMYRAGFRWLLTGFESGSPRILDNINKKASREDNDRCFQLARAAGLKVKALMSLGHPGESPETIRETRDWLLEVKPDDFDVTIITTYPGSPYYDEAVEFKGEIASDNRIWTYTCPKSKDRLHSIEIDYNEVADYYKGDPDGGYTAYVFTDHLTTGELVEWRDRVEDEVRAALSIPFNPGAPQIRYEHSMGQSGPLPRNILRHSPILSPRPRKVSLKVIE